MKRSLVWNYFTSITKDLASCIACAQEVCTGTNSTSGLHKHLKVHHVDEYMKYQRLQLQEEKLAKSAPDELMASATSFEDYDGANGSGFGGVSSLPKGESSTCEVPQSAPRDTKHDINAELAEVSSLLDLAIPTANVNVLADEGMEEEAMAIEVRPKTRPFRSNGFPQAKWSVVILWLPPGTISVYVLKMDRRIADCKKFQTGQTLEVVEHVKSHAFVNTRWEVCPGACDVVPSLTASWEGCDSGDSIEYGSNCDLLVPEKDRHNMSIQCKFCETVASGPVVDEMKNAFKEEAVPIDTFDTGEMYEAAPEVKVKIEEPEDYPDAALPEVDNEDAFVTEANSGYSEGTDSFNTTAPGNSQTRSKRSFVWNYFTCITKELASCKTCNRELPTKYGSSSGLVNHLRAHHKPMYHDLMKKKRRQVHQGQVEVSETKLEDFGPLGETQNFQNDIKVEGIDGAYSCPKPVSFVWDYFTKKDESNAAQIVKCNTCSKDISYCGTTSNLAKHLHLHHQQLYAELQSKRQSRISQSPRKQPSFTRKEVKRESFKCEVCQMPFKGPHCRKKWARHMQTHKGQPGVYIPPPPGKT